MKRFFLLAILMLATFASAQQADSTDILITVREDGDTLQTGRWRSGMPVRVRDSWSGWGERERLANKFVIVRVGVEKSRIDSFLVAHSDSTTGLRRKYQLSRSAIQFVKNNRDENNVVRVTPAQLRNAFKRANRLRRLGEPQRMGILTPDLFIRWRNMLVAPTLTSVTVNTDGGGDYTTWVAAEAGEQDDLVTANEQLTINLSGVTADNGAVVFAGWTTDATRKVIFQGNNNTGIWDDNKYTHSVATDNYGLFFNSSSNYVDINNIQFLPNKASVATIAIQLISNSQNTVSINGCLFKKGGSATLNSQGVNISENSTLNVKNTIFYDLYFGAICNTNASAILNISNSTFYNIANTAIYRGNGTVTAKNNLVNNSTDGFFGTISGDYNQSDVSDAQMPGAHSITATVTFTDAESGDFSLAAESPGIDQGANLSAEGITTDIKGVSRPQGDAFDIGAFEFPVTNDTNTDTKKHKWLEWIKRKKN